jgi:hypothetical protein
MLTDYVKQLADTMGAAAGVGAPPGRIDETTIRPL